MCVSLELKNCQIKQTKLSIHLTNFKSRYSNSLKYIEYRDFIPFRNTLDEKLLELH